ncbi:CPBP family intramembrane glutamic endopeptidase [Mucilaginibacter sp.]|uniref:CPBP family intramembrane glutamic endopeptidase n=1 Tax=Mucilaginibacter sp. TaxID=1882438 RepID=UPI002C9222A5|nr:CPBP family intramembrane glutamic endopeptidase [Mucilaginibacter sp.]HTI60358.1 CPBP family intramembrane glutamic endopeptidase [Mucilaginibacter sp.]
MTEGSSNPIPHKQIHPGLQFLILMGILIATIIAGNFIAGAIVVVRYGTDTLLDIANLKLGSQQVQSSLWTIQFIGTTLPILVTPIIFAYRIVHDPDDYIKHHFDYPRMLMAVVFVAMLAVFPFIQYLGDLNSKMVLPEALKGVEHWMRQSEDEAQKLSDTMMRMPTFWSMIYDLLFIGLLTAIVEEILFRGCFQTVFFRWTKHIHVAIWITAILFSAFHQEFYGFLPRLALGLLFGYFTAWSGSIWPAILAHFVNNGTAVVWTYLLQNNITNLDPDKQKLFSNVIFVASFLATMLLLFFYKYISDKWQAAHHGEELD